LQRATLFSRRAWKRRAGSPVGRVSPPAGQHGQLHSLALRQSPLCATLKWSKVAEVAEGHATMTKGRDLLCRPGASRAGRDRSSANDADAVRDAEQSTVVERRATGFSFAPIRVELLSEGETEPPL
jgi:hypothetical protein